MHASTLERIDAEHKVIAAMMTALEAETAALETQGFFDLDLVRLILRYMYDYPDRFHHPKEEVLFDVAAAKNADFAERVQGLRGQHDDLPSMTENLMATIDAIEMGESLPRQQVLSALKTYAVRQREHIASERDDIFPALEGVLSDDDWRAAAERIAEMEDPLTGGADPGPYRRLQSIILAQK